MAARTAVLAGQALRILELAGFRLHEDDAGLARQHDDGVGGDPVIADQAGEGTEREVEADHAAPAQRHAGRHADDVGLGEVVGLGQYRRVGPDSVDVPWSRARIVVEMTCPRRAAAAIGHLEPPGLAPRRTLALDLAQDDGGSVGRIELQALLDREGFRPAGIEEAAVFVADEHRRPGGIPTEQSGELAETFLVGVRPRIGREARRLGERRADRHDDAQARPSGSLRPRVSSDAMRWPTLRVSR